VSARTALVIAKAMEKNPADRYQTAAEFAAAIDEVLASLRPDPETFPGAEKHSAGACGRAT
jgi:hypothetical protein